MIRFSIFGIPVEIQPWFWITMGVIGYMSAGNAGGEGMMLLLLLFVLAGLVSILVHELGHALAGMCFKADPYIVLHSFGGYAAFPGSHFTRTQSFLVTAAGPALQILLGVVAFVVVIFVPEEKAMFEYFFRVLAGVSFLWAILNLVPVHPLDGGQMMFAMMGPKREKAAWWISMVSGVVAGVAFIASGYFPIMGAMMLMMVFQNYQTYSSIYR